MIRHRSTPLELERDVFWTIADAITRARSGYNHRSGAGPRSLLYAFQACGIARDMPHQRASAGSPALADAAVSKKDTAEEATPGAVRLRADLQRRQARRTGGPPPAPSPPAAMSLRLLLLPVSTANQMTRAGPYVPACRLVVRPPWAPMSAEVQLMAQLHDYGAPRWSSQATPQSGEPQPTDGSGRPPRGIRYGGFRVMGHERSLDDAQADSPRLGRRTQRRQGACAVSRAGLQVASAPLPDPRRRGPQTTKRRIPRGGNRRDLTPRHLKHVISRGRCRHPLTSGCSDVR